MGHVARVEEMRNAYNSSIGKPEGKRPNGRLIRSCENNIRMIFGILGGKLRTIFMWIGIGTIGRRTR
jgi:hypothetical protein